MAPKKEKRLQREKQPTQPVHKSISKLAKLFSILQIPRKDFSIALILSWISSVISVFEMIILLILIRGIIDKSFIDGGRGKLFMDLIPGAEQQPFIVHVLAVAIVLCLILWISNVLHAKASLRIERQTLIANRTLRSTIFNRLLTFSKSYFDTKHLSDIRNIFHETRIVSDQIINVHVLCSQLLTLLFFVGILWWISWQITIFAMVAVLVPPIFIRQYIKRLRKLSIQERIAKQKHLRSINRLISSIPLIKITVQEEKEQQHFYDLNTSELENSLQVKRTKLRMDSLQQLGATSSILLTVGVAPLLLPGVRMLDPAYFILIFFLLRKMQPVIKRITGAGISLMREGETIDDILWTISPESDTYVLPDGEKEFTELQQGIAFKSLQFAYEDGTTALHNVSFEMQKGKTVALVGETGSGKTTIANLLLRFYDCPPGSIFIDGTDIRQFTRASLLQHMAVVTQDTMLFHDTLRANITYGLDDVEEDDLEEVLRFAQLEESVAEFPDRLETMIGNRGDRLSGGEKQRTSIARMLLKQGASIFILDEASSALDTKTEEMVMRAIHEKGKEKTVLIIAHRLSTIRHADQIILLEQGRIVEQGTFDELIELNNQFALYWEKHSYGIAHE